MENCSPMNISYKVPIGNDGADDVLWALTAWQMPVHIEAGVACHRSIWRSSWTGHCLGTVTSSFTGFTCVLHRYRNVFFNFIPVGSHVF
jgi:hypothetical protein